MKELKRNLIIVLLAVGCLFVWLGGHFAYAAYTNGSRWLINPHNPRLSQSKQRVTAGDILDRNGLRLAYTDGEGERVYSGNKTMRKSVSHTVGDPLAMSGSGVETFHAGYLLGFSSNVLDRTWQFISGKDSHGDNVHLTIDAELSKYIYSEFPDGKNGAVVLLNYRTGEILASVSLPGYDPSLVARRKNQSSDDSFVNRATQGQYPPGSTFKLVTAAAAIEAFPDLFSREFSCEGDKEFGTGAVRDTEGKGHGELDFEDAFVRSCNITFATLAVDLGEERMKRKAEAMGFNSNFMYRDLMLYPSKYPAVERGDYELAWSGVGQGRVLVTPMHMAMLAGAIAADGNMVEPKLISSVTGVGGIPKLRIAAPAGRRVVTADTARILQTYMEEVVTKGTGKKAAVKGYTVAGKTGTAEFSDDKKVKPHAWFIGYVKDAGHPLAIAVVVEKGGSGGEIAAPVAAKVLKKAIGLGY